MLKGKLDAKRKIYGQRSSTYFGLLNPAVVSLLRPADSMMEIGCGEGKLGEYSRRQKLFRKQIGIEFHAPSARKAKAWYDKVYIQDAELFLISKSPTVEAIVCADVIEHFVDPWLAFEKLASSLRCGGYMILSIPNARHVRVWGSLVLRGRFDYEHAGVRDKGHLRFFALKNLIELFEANRMAIEEMVWNKAPKGRVLDLLTFGILKEFFTFQFIFRLRRY